LDFGEQTAQACANAWFRQLPTILLDFHRLYGSRPAGNQNQIEALMKMSKHRVLLCGILSPVLALIFYALVYGTLTRYSADLEKDWLFRLSISTVAMTIPFFATIALAMKTRPEGGVSLSAKVGLLLAVLSLGLTAWPIRDGLLRAKQTRNMAMHDVNAPSFDTVDINGKAERLSDHAGKVVLVNIWATWCGPCRSEMPKLDHLYRERKDKGLVVLGISDEDVGVQQKYLQQVPVSYPLLTVKGTVPSLYRDIARYPAIFLIDRNGRLQPAPGPDQPFEKLEATVEALLTSRS
jgi:thiol-disulfide isomerase/thioredoxin